MLLNFTLDLRDFLIEFFDILLLSGLLVLQLLLLVFFLLPKRLVFPDVVLQVRLVILELLGAIYEGLMASLLLFFQLLDLLVHRVVREFSEEHFFLLVDELVHILGSLLAWELHSASGDMHGFVDMILLFQVEILLLWIMFTG